MVDSKRYTPSNKRFQEHTQSFVEGTTRKGHLNTNSKKGEKYKTTGTLIRIKIKEIYGNGWEVKIDKKTYYCNYGDNIVYLPPYTKTNLYYIPKSKCEVEVSIDKKNKMYTITRISNSEKQPIAMDNTGLVLKGTKGASIKVSEGSVEASGDQLSVENDVKIDTTKNKDISANKISVVEMYKDIQKVKDKLDIE